MNISRVGNKVLSVLVPFAFFLGGLGHAMAAEDAQTPATLAGAKIVAADEVKKMSDAKGAFFVDTRSPVNFGKGHVPGAVSIAYKEKSEKVANFDASADKFDLSRLPADKNARIVFYSDGPSGWKSYKAAVLTVNAGYKNVMYFRDGYSNWVSKGYPEEK
jgi:rhodanese-related sulfurtransferase